MARPAEAAHGVAPVAGAASFLERYLGLTTTGALLIGFAATGWLLARFIGSRGMFFLAYGVVLVVVVAFVIGRRRLSVAAVRSDLPMRVRESQSVIVELALTAKRRVSTIVLEESLHAHLGPSIRVPISLLPGGQTVEHVYSFTPRLRGVYEVGPLAATWSDPFGLTKRKMVLAPATKIIVHPSTELVHDRVVSREWEDPPIRPPISKPWPSGFEFYGMRDYASGDDPRRIVWRATARTLDPVTGAGRYLVRESEQGITDRVSLLLDTDRRTHSPDTPSETFEAGIRTIASLGVRHLQDGFAVTLESNARRLAEALRGRPKQIPFLDELAKLQPERAQLREMVDRLVTNQRRDSHLVLATPHLDEDTATRLRLLLDRGASLMVVLLMWEDSDPVSAHRAGALGCNVVEVTSGAPLSGVFARAVGGAGRR